MPKCVITGQEATWAWQPFGPDENPREAFTLLGSHYRGFPVVKVSDVGKERIQRGETVNFIFRRNLWKIDGDKIYEAV